jgi:excinuclease ABC subunit C
MPLLKIEELRLQADQFPISPGVYLMKDAADQLLYIGKALNLRSRVRSYFSDSHEDRPLIPVMLRKLDHIDWIATNNETEALILEANLIRQHKPPCNVDLKDDKHYPYLKITVNEPFPRLLVVRRVLPDKARYFGPYTDVVTMNGLVTFARTAFGIHRCNRNMPPEKPVRPCLHHAIGACSGPCGAKITREEYSHSIRQCIDFLAGRHTEVMAGLQAAMETAAESLDFELAASLRDRLRLIRKSPLQQQVDLKNESGSIDVFGYVSNDRALCLCVLSFRNGLLLAKRHFLIKRELWDFSAETIETSVIQYYRSSQGDPPAEIILPAVNAASTGLIQAWFSAERNICVSVGIAQRGGKIGLVGLAEKNAQLYLLQKVAPEPEADLRQLQTVLGLPRLPRTIEAFDISNLGGSFCVAGMVHFRDGKPDKSLYRRYKIRSVEGQDDFAMLNEAVQRRLTRLQNEGKPYPDLLLIDGGKGQLSAAMQPLAGFENPPMIASLAKKEETLFSPWIEEGITLPENHPARKLVQRIRDEVHRQAVGYHRNLRDGQFKRSGLEQIPGVGPARSRLLLRHFGSQKLVAAAPAEQIAELKGFTPALAATILRHLRST